MRTRPHRIWARLSEEEYAKFQRSVKKSGMTQGAYLRALINGCSPRQPPPADYYAMTRELHAIGNLMNQIAARANTTGFFLAKEYTGHVKALHEQILKIRAAVEQPERIVNEDRKNEERTASNAGRKSWDHQKGCEKDGL